MPVFLLSASSPFPSHSTQTPEFPHGDGSCPGPCDCGVNPCGEYIFDHRNASLQSFILDDLLGPTALGNENITGFYLDDEWYNFSIYTGGCSGSPVGGPTEEDTHCLEDMGLAGDIGFTTAMTAAWCDTRHLAFEKVREAGGWFWQMFNEQQTPSQAQCASTLRAA